MLSHIADLSDDNEYFLGWTGQSLSRPWGDLSELKQLLADYDLDAVGSIFSKTRTRPSGSATVSVTNPALVTQLDHDMVTDEIVFMEAELFPKKGTVVASDALTIGVAYEIATHGGGADWTTVGATANTVGLAFVATGTSAGAGDTAYTRKKATETVDGTAYNIEALSIDASNALTPGDWYTVLTIGGGSDWTTVGGQNVVGNVFKATGASAGAGDTAANTGTTDWTLVGAPNNGLDTQFEATGAAAGDGIAAEIFWRGVPYYATVLGATSYTLATTPDSKTWLEATSTGLNVRMRRAQELVLLAEGFASPEVSVNEYVDAAFRLGNQLQLQTGYAKTISNLQIGTTPIVFTAGLFAVGHVYEIASGASDTPGPTETDFRTVGAASNTIGLRFVATAKGTGGGTATYLFPMPKFTVHTAGQITPTVIYEILYLGGAQVSAASVVSGNWYTIGFLGTTNWTALGASGSPFVGESFLATSSAGAGSGTAWDTGTTDYMLIGATSNAVGTRFTATGAGTGTGKAQVITVLQPSTGIHFVRWETPPEEPLITAGSFIPGMTYQIQSQGSTDFLLIGAVSNNAGTVFVATGVGTGSGKAYRMDAEVESYTMHEDFKWASYPQVRVLTPYQPTEKDDWPTERRIPYPDPTADFGAGGRRITLPAPWVNPSTPITDFADLAVFLDVTLQEGIKGYGISDRTDSTAVGAITNLPHEISSINGRHWTFGVISGSYTGVGVVKADVLTNARLLVDWEDSGVMKRSWAKITGNTLTTFQVDPASWLGDGDPGTGNHAKIKRYTAWVPWMDDSPYSWLPGEGFTYPNNDMQPYTDSTDAAGGVIMNRPRGRVFPSYPGNIGEVIVVATRLSMAIGKRINVVILGVNGSQIAPSPTRNFFGFQGHCGWYDQADDWTWSPADTKGLWARLTHLLTTCLPNAMAAEANTKPVKFIGWVHSQGESDGMNDGARLHYSRSLRGFQQAVRNKLKALTNADGSTFNPYADEAQLPWIQPRIMRTPYELKGTFTYYAGSVVIDGDSNGLVNNAIIELVNADPFTDTIWCDDCPRDLPDGGHLNGVGHAMRAMRISKKITQLIDYAFSFGSSALVNSKDRVVDICNRALAMIGQDPALVSLTENTEEARLCRLFYKESRDTLLRLRQWGFALRRRQLDELHMDEQHLYSQWGFCYAVPEQAMSAFRVFPPEEIIEDFDDSVVLNLSYTDTVVAAFDTTYGLSDEVSIRQIDQSLLPLTTAASLTPQKFHIERSPEGGRRLYTNQEQATLQYVERVSDPGEYPPDFEGALAALLASKLAGALIRGPQSMKVADEMRTLAGSYVESSASSDAFEQEPEENGFFEFIPDHLNFRNQ